MIAGLCIGTIVRVLQARDMGDLSGAVGLVLWFDPLRLTDRRAKEKMMLVHDQVMRRCVGPINEPSWCVELTDGQEIFINECLIDVIATPWVVSS